MRQLQLFLFCISLSLNSISLATPLEFEARYSAKAMGLTASAQRSSTRTPEGTYRLQNSLELTVMSFSVGSIRETSEFAFIDDQVQSLSYEYSQTGVSSTSETIFFDWDNATAASVVEDESVQVPIENEILDKLNFGVRLGLDLELSEQDEHVYKILDGDEIEEHTYRITARETVATPLGDIATIRLERVRAATSKRKTTIWLAPDWQYLLVKLQQVSSSGTMTEILLESAQIDGKSL